MVEERKKTERELGKLLGTEILYFQIELVELFK